MAERLRILNVPVDAVDMDGALRAVEDYVKTADRPGYVLAVNPEKVFAVRSDPFLQQFFELAALLIPDGIGVVMGLRFLYGVAARRVPGADLMQAICARSAETGQRLFLYGASEEVNERAVAELQSRYPGIQIAGRAHGYHGPEDMPDLVASINSSDTDILFVALGSPAQERWIHEHLPVLKVKLCQGIGGTLDTIAGKVRRAPRVFRSLGLEWLYRLLSQPSRAWRQRVLPWFAWQVLCEKLRGPVRAQS